MPQDVVTAAEYRRLLNLPPAGADRTPAPPTAPAAGERERMNKTEAAYAELLELRRRAGDIRSFQFEAIKLRLAGRTWYQPDFLVEPATGRPELHEVKGFWRDDARVKFKVSAELFPAFRFVVVRRVDHSWSVEAVS